MTAFLCLSVNFEKFFRTPLLKSTSTKLLSSCTSCKIATSGYSKKLFHSCFSSILFKNEKYSFEVYLYLKSLKLSVKKLIRHEVACYQPASLRKKLFHTFSHIFLRTHHNCSFWRGYESVRAQFLSGNISENVVLLVIYLFNWYSSKTTFFMLNMHFGREQDNCPPDNYPLDNCSPDNCPPPPSKLPPQ